MIRYIFIILFFPSLLIAQSRISLNLGADLGGLFQGSIERSVSPNRTHFLPRIGSNIGMIVNFPESKFALGGHLRYSYSRMYIYEDLGALLPRGVEFPRIWLNNEHYELAFHIHFPIYEKEKWCLQSHFGLMIGIPNSNSKVPNTLIGTQRLLYDGYLWELDYLIDRREYRTGGGLEAGLKLGYYFIPNWSIYVSSYFRMGFFDMINFEYAGIVNPGNWDLPKHMEIMLDNSGVFLQLGLQKDF